jgi:hypothetical protein
MASSRSKFLPWRPLRWWDRPDKPRRPRRVHAPGAANHARPSRRARTTCEPTGRACALDRLRLALRVAVDGFADGAPVSRTQPARPGVGQPQRRNEPSQPVDSKWNSLPPPLSTAGPAGGAVSLGGGPRRRRLPTERTRPKPMATKTARTKTPPRHKRTEALRADRARRFPHERTVAVNGTDEPGSPRPLPRPGFRSSRSNTGRAAGLPSPRRACRRPGAPGAPGGPACARP